MGRAIAVRIYAAPANARDPFRLLHPAAAADDYGQSLAAAINSLASIDTPNPRRYDRAMMHRTEGETARTGLRLSDVVAVVFATLLIPFFELLISLIFPSVICLSSQGDCMASRHPKTLKV
jgi:hypothetical protein